MRDPQLYVDGEGGDGHPSMVREGKRRKPTAENLNLADVLNLLGQRWTASIIRRLHAGFDRFNAISRELGINPNTLKTRLGELQHEGLVTRIEESKIPPRTRYELTERGLALAQIVTLLQEWVNEEAYRASDLDG